VFVILKTHALHKYHGEGYSSSAVRELKVDVHCLGSLPLVLATSMIKASMYRITHPEISSFEIIDADGQNIQIG
jgi:hypothetical protein